MERAGQDVDQFSRYNSTCFIIVAEHGLRKVFETKGIAAWYFYGPAAAENNFYYIVSYVSETKTVWDWLYHRN